MWLFQVDSELWVFANRSFYQINAEKHEIVKAHNLPDPIDPMVDNDQEVDDKVLEEKKVKPASPIICVTLSPDQRYFAIATVGEKCLTVIKRTAGVRNIAYIYTRQLTRTPSVLRFSSDSEQLLVADKTGDCFVYNVGDGNNSKWVLGHLGMLLDAVFSWDKRFIVSCDRDEKVRVTNYPHSHIIESYCLGHQEYVSAVEFLPHNAEHVLLSVSGDKTLRMWLFQSGKELKRLDLTASGVKLAVKPIDSKRSLVAVAMCKPDSLAIYCIAGDEPGNMSVDFMLHKNLDGIISSIHFDNQLNLYVCSASDHSCFVLKQFAYDAANDTVTDKDVNRLNDLLAGQLECSDIQIFDVSILFKKKFDNMKQYLERKKRRIERI